MIFGPYEILICLVAVLLVSLTLAAGLLAQNIYLFVKERRSETRCPACFKPVNAEAYICRHCHRELFPAARASEFSEVTRDSLHQ